MKLDATYTLTAGTDNEEITLTDIITTAGTRSVKTMSDPKGGKRQITATTKELRLQNQATRLSEPL